MKFLEKISKLNFIKMTKINNQNQFYQTNYKILEKLPKLTSLSIYTKSTFIGLWILIKWVVYLLWSNLIYNNRNSNKRKNKSLQLQSNYYGAGDDNDNDGNGFHYKPPLILVDNKIGRHSYVKLKNVKLHYVEAGKQSDPLVLLLHGFPDCWLGWRNQIQEFSRFFRVVALDMKGFNDSDKPILRHVYTPRKICEELRQFIFSLGYSNVTIIGHDIGAVIGWFFVHTNPNNIDKFICVSASHPNIIWNSLNSKSVMNDSWLQFIQMPLLPELDHSSLHSKFLEKCLKSVQSSMDNNTKNSSAVINVKKLTNTENLNNDNDYNFNIIDTYKYVFNRRADWTGPFNYYRNFPFYRIKEGYNVRCPVLIVTGNGDEICQLESIVKSTDYCDSFVVKIIEGAGHWPHQQIPMEFNKVVLSFLVGRRAQPEQLQLEKSSKSIVGSLLGAVSQSVKIGTSVLDSVQHHTNNLRSSIQQVGGTSNRNNDEDDDNDPFF